MVSVTLGICALIEERGVIQLIKEGFKEGVNEVILVTPNKKLAKTVQMTFNNSPSINIILEGKREGKSAAINKILRRATGDIIVMASADVRIKKGSIKKLVKKMIDEGDNVGAVDSHVILLDSGKKFFNKVVNFTWTLHNLTMMQLNNNGRLGHVAGDLYALRKGLVSRIPAEVINDDAYIAMIIKLKGYDVLHEDEAICYILGPQNPYDYIVQRSRVLYGHFQIYKILKRYPTTFQFTAFKRPLFAVNIFKRAMKHFGAAGILYILTGLLLEFLAILHASLYVIKRSSPLRWKLAMTTKKLFT